MSPFLVWIKNQGGPRLAASKLKVTERAVYKWINRDATPHPKTIKAIVRLSRGRVTYQDILEATLN